MTLICAPADVELATPGSDYTHKCSACGERVVLAPSGQKLLREHPDVTVLCIHCYRPKDGDEFRITSAALAEFRTAVPNTWRNRN